MNSSMEKRQASDTSEFQENLEILRQMDFFSALSLQAIKVFAYLFTREMFKPGDYLFRKDDSGEFSLGNYGEGEFLGGLALLGDMRRLFSLKAVTDMRCLVMSREKFLKAIEQFPELIPRVLETVVDRIRSWEERLLIDQEGLCDRCRMKVGVSLV